MLDKIGINELREYIRNSQDIYANAQWTDQYKFLITREAPLTSAEIQPEEIRSFNINFSGMNLKESQSGSAHINTIESVTPLSVEVTFLESVRSKVFKFLTMTDAGDRILPNDGTYLLPYDYFFHISAYSLDEWLEPSLLLSGSFLVSGELPKEFDAEGGKKQDLTVTFKPILSNAIRYSDKSNLGR